MDTIQRILTSEAMPCVLSEFPGARVDGGKIAFDGGEIRLKKRVFPNSPDGFSIQETTRGWDVGAGSACGMYSGLLNLADALKHGQTPPPEILPRFTSRLYKHELNIGKAWGFHRPVSELNADFWMNYAKQLVRMHFNGMVFYPGGSEDGYAHPFTSFLDFKSFSDAVDQSPDAREWRIETRRGLKRALRAMQAFGLKTYMQHYITHYPRRLLEARGKKHAAGAVDSAVGRDAAFDDPLVERYSKYVYRRTFELLPELTGLYVNFESAENAHEFVRNVMYKGLSGLKRTPEIVFRLWGFNALPEMVRLEKAYPGKVILAHKIMDRSDAYYFPRADPRVIEWKQAMPDTEFMFLIGPCHNCATVQSDLLWADHDFIHDTLADAEKKGADSIAYHTVIEHLSTDIDIGALSKESEIHLSMFNRGHLDAVVDYVRGLSPDIGREAARYAGRLALPMPAARKLAKLMRDVSAVSVLSLQQQFYTSTSEGYISPPVTSAYQDPFYFMDMSLPNMEPRLPLAVLINCWLARTNTMKNIPAQTQPVFDYVNPAKKTAAHHPLWIAREARRAGEKASRAAHALRQKHSRSEFDTLVVHADKMRDWGERLALEMTVAAGLYPLYFEPTKSKALAGLARAESALIALKPVVKRLANAPGKTYLFPNADPGRDLAGIRRLIRYIEKGGFPWDAFTAFGRSMERYVDIRRRYRPDRRVTPEIIRMIKKRLAAALRFARVSEDKLSANRYRKRVADWRECIEDELVALVEPAMDVHARAGLGADDGFVRLRHDQAFRFGESALGDFLGFFTRRGWLPTHDLFFRLAWDAAGLWVSMKEDGIDIDSRREIWERYAGSSSNGFFLRIFADPAGEGRACRYWRILPKGRRGLCGDWFYHDRQHIDVPPERAFTGGVLKWREHDSGYRIDVMIPWRELGGRPNPGDTMRVNVAANPYIARNHQACWCAGYEMAPGKNRMGVITFVE